MDVLSCPNDADDSDSSDGSGLKVKALPRRSATVSPSTRSLLREPLLKEARRCSDFNLDVYERKRRRSMARNNREASDARRRLRKTSSEPNVEDVGVSLIRSLRKDQTTSSRDN
ncbi:hypothetical protein GCK32_019099 [Trichostrongylus colubriformis]|uniref:Uncharacterized protein n=1 Tax=Trichostrongylus colubriformis TaxID=6319 RepID=A0AAN8EZZ5_TRICO